MQLEFGSVVNLILTPAADHNCSAFSTMEREIHTEFRCKLALRSPLHLIYKGDLTLSGALSLDRRLTGNWGLSSQVEVKVLIEAVKLNQRGAQRSPPLTKGTDVFLVSAFGTF